MDEFPSLKFLNPFSNPARAGRPGTRLAAPARMTRKSTPPGPRAPWAAYPGEPVPRSTKPPRRRAGAPPGRAAGQALRARLPPQPPSRGAAAVLRARPQHRRDGARRRAGHQAGRRPVRRRGAARLRGDEVDQPRPDRAASPGAPGVGRGAAGCAARRRAGRRHGVLRRGCAGGGATPAAARPAAPEAGGRLGRARAGGGARRGGAAGRGGALSPWIMERLGVVLEEDLAEVETYSVGWARVGKMESRTSGRRTHRRQRGQCGLWRIGAARGARRLRRAARLAAG